MPDSPHSNWIPHADDAGRVVIPLYGPRGEVLSAVSNKPWVPTGFQPSQRASDGPVRKEEPGRR